MNCALRLPNTTRGFSGSGLGAALMWDQLCPGIIPYEIGLGRLLHERELDVAVEAKAAVAARAAWDAVMAEAKQM